MKMNNLELKKTTLLIFMVLTTLLHAKAVSSQTISQILDSNTIRIGYRTDTPPLSFKDEEGKADGYSVAICNHIAKVMSQQFNKPDLKILHVPVTSENRFSTLTEGQIDILCGASSITLSRRQTMSFSIPVFLSGMGAVVHQDISKELNALLLGQEPEFRPRWRANYGQILHKKTMTVLGGTTAEKWLNTEIKHFNIPAKLDLVSSYSEGIEDILNKKSDVFFGDRAVLMNAINKSEHASELKFLDRQYSYESISLAMKDGDKAFNIFVDRILSRIYETGEVNEIYKRYFGELDSTAKSLFTRAALPE